MYYCYTILRVVARQLLRSDCYPIAITQLQDKALVDPENQETIKLIEKAEKDKLSAIETAREKGLAECLEKGLETGKKEGIAEGKLENQKQIALNIKR